MVQNDLCTSDIWTYQWMKNSTRLLIGDSYFTNKAPTGSHQWSGLKVKWRLTLSMLTFLCIILMGNFCPAKLFSFPLSVWGTSIQSESWTKLSLDWSFDQFNAWGFSWPPEMLFYLFTYDDAQWLQHCTLSMNFHWLMSVVFGGKVSSDFFTKLALAPSSVSNHGAKCHLFIHGFDIHVNGNQHWVCGPEKLI